MKGLAIALALVATQADALSCMRPDVAQSFQRASGIEEPVYILRGTLKFDESRFPQGVVNEERNPDPVPAMFKGHGLTLDGFTARFESPVILQPLCFGPWCGNAVSGQEAIAFATVYPEGILIEVSPCGGHIYYDPSPDMAGTLTACLRGEACVSAQAFE